MDETQADNPPQENPTLALERTCMSLLEQGNGLVEEQPLRAQEICATIAADLRLAEINGWKGLAQIKAMHALLEANALAYLGPATKQSLYDKYLAAIRLADKCPYRPGQPSYGLQARRAYAAVLAFYRDFEDAEFFLEAILESLKREQNEGLWLQATVQTAEVYWLQGKITQAHQLLKDALCYREGNYEICKDYVAGLVLMTRLCWHNGQQRLGRQYAGSAVREAIRLDPSRKQVFTKRVIRLTNPFGYGKFQGNPGPLRAALGILAYEVMFKQARCQRL